VGVLVVPAVQAALAVRVVMVARLVHVLAVAVAVAAQLQGSS
jgi:hypothetical protein